MIAYLRWPLVVHVGDPPPFALEFDTVMSNAVNPVVGTIWNGSAFVSPPANSEQANTVTLRQQALTAITNNQQALAQLVTWRTTGPGAGSANLTSAQLSAATRTAALNQEAQFKQLNGIIRLLLGQLDGTD